MTRQTIRALAVTLAFVTGAASTSAELPGFAPGLVAGLALAGAYALAGAVDQRKPEPWGEL